ncbi:MAG: hypothetical protein NTZ98_23330, partial [Acidobacteria bacterium]|nr:hypothetical protein [Acidobacteriota bacterium]
MEHVGVLADGNQTAAFPDPPLDGVDLIVGVRDSRGLDHQHVDVPERVVVDGLFEPRHLVEPREIIIHTSVIIPGVLAVPGGVHGAGGRFPLGVAFFDGHPAGLALAHGFPHDCGREDGARGRDQRRGGDQTPPGARPLGGRRGRRRRLRLGPRGAADEPPRQQDRPRQERKVQRRAPELVHHVHRVVILGHERAVHVQAQKKPRADQQPDECGQGQRPGGTHQVAGPAAGGRQRACEQGRYTAHHEAQGRPVEQEFPRRREPVHLAHREHRHRA